jgi:hypothetical protein
MGPKLNALRLCGQMTLCIVEICWRVHVAAAERAGRWCWYQFNEETFIRISPRVCVCALFYICVCAKSAVSFFHAPYCNLFVKMIYSMVREGGRAKRKYSTIIVLSHCTV